MSSRLYNIYYLYFVVYCPTWCMLATLMSSHKHGRCSIHQSQVQYMYAWRHVCVEARHMEGARERGIIYHFDAYMRKNVTKNDYLTFRNHGYG